MHPKGVANITCTNQLQKTMNLQKNETAEDTIWHATSIAHAGHCTNKSAPKMIIILCEAMSLSLSPSISLLKSVFKSRYMSLCKRTIWLPCHQSNQSLKMMCPSIGFYSFTPTPYQVHLELTVPVLQQEYTTLKKLPGGSWKWTLLLVSRLCKSKTTLQCQRLHNTPLATWIHCNIPKKLISVSYDCISMYT